MIVGVVGLSVLLFCPTVSALDKQPRLKRQSDAHQMFLLRDALRGYQPPSDFYAGEIACAFNDTIRCEEQFGQVLAAEPKSPAARQIHDILTAVSLRQGHYAGALQEVNALLALDPNDSHARGSLPLLEALSHFPDQAVQGASKATIQLDDGKLPVLINGKRASYYFDSGANLSTLSESDALQFGMEIHEIRPGAVSTDISGNRVSFRVALAKSFALGGIELRNVAFLVTTNDQRPFVDMQPGQRGLVGLPVLCALGAVKWTREGAFQADRSPTPADLSAANLFFDDLDLITEASFEGHAFPFVLDTGAAHSELWPKFASVAGDVIRKSGVHQNETVIGMGGDQKFEVISIPKILLDLGGMPVALQPADILNTQQRDEGKWFYGNLGIDLLRQAQTVTMDLRTMTLRLDNPAEPRTHNH